MFRAIVNKAVYQRLTCRLRLRSVFALFCAVIDTIIVGQGICGTLLSFELYKRQKSFVVVDPGHQQSASFAASGLINPVTGKRFVKSWMHDEFVALALNTYREIEQLLEVSLIHEYDLLQFHKTGEGKRVFESRMAEQPLLSSASPELWQQYFNFSYGCGSISPCYVIDSHMLLSSWRKKLYAEGFLIEEGFSWDNCVVTDHIGYKDITSNRIIFCDGSAAIDNPYFKLLPFSCNKGQAIIADIPGLPGDVVYSNDLKLVPIGGNSFWIGSSFEWNYVDAKPTQDFYERVHHFLHSFLKTPYAISGHYAAIRPASVDYRPFVGFHPHQQNVGILNGMGSKGYSQAPYFAHNMAEAVYNGGSIMPAADVKRFERILRNT